MNNLICFSGIGCLLFGVYSTYISLPFEIAQRKISCGFIFTFFGILLILLSMEYKYRKEKEKDGEDLVRKIVTQEKDKKDFTINIQYTDRKIIWITFASVPLAILLFAIADQLIRLIIGTPTTASKAANSYDILKDTLSLVLAISGIVIAVAGGLLYKVIHDKTTSDIEKITTNLDDYALSSMWCNIGYKCYIDYLSTGKKLYLENAIKFTGKSEVPLMRLDRKDERNLKLVCYFMNNFGYFLAEEGKLENKETALQCAEFIKKHLVNYLSEREEWEDTIKFITGKYGTQ